MYNVWSWSLQPITNDIPEKAKTMPIIVKSSIRKDMPVYVM